MVFSFLTRENSGTFKEFFLANSLRDEKSGLTHFFATKEIGSKNRNILEQNQIQCKTNSSSHPQTLTLLKFSKFLNGESSTVENSENNMEKYCLPQE
jgi:hypothetical protein